MVEASHGVALSKDLTTSTQPLHMEKKVLLSIGVYSYTTEASVAKASFDYTHSYESARYIIHGLREPGDEETAKLLDEIADRISKKIDAYVLARIVDEDRKER